MSSKDLMKERHRDFKEVMVIKDGGSFGELALLQTGRRSASVICKTNCHFLILTSGDFKHTLGGIKGKKLDAQIKFLKSMPLFVNMSNHTIIKYTPYLLDVRIQHN